MIWFLIATAAALFLSHVCKGVCDTLHFHYDGSRFARFDNQRFWNPKLSWENKYAPDVNDLDGDGDREEAERPLRPRFAGSATWFVLVTDAWHLFQSIQYALVRIAVTLLICVALFASLVWWYPLAVYAALWVVQAAGFHLIYTLYAPKKSK